MTDTANAREIIRNTMPPSGNTDYWTDAVIAALRAAGLEIRPIAPPAGKDVGEELWEVAKLAYDSGDDIHKPEYQRLRTALEAIRVPLIQQGLREAAEMCVGWDWSIGLLRTEILARADAMEKGEE